MPRVGTVSDELRMAASCVQPNSKTSLTAQLPPGLFPEVVLTYVNCTNNARAPNTGRASKTDQSVTGIVPVAVSNGVNT